MPDSPRRLWPVSHSSPDSECSPLCRECGPVPCMTRYPSLRPPVDQSESATQKTAEGE
jgi:hypothetical protein